MLDEITARNLGLIERAAIRLSPRLTVITGETGAGKTLMLGALRLLRGDKAGRGVVGPADTSCEVSARFVLADRELIVRRHVDDSRSRAYIDDAAATATALGDALAGEVAIIGQHDQLAITSTAGVRSLIDRRLTSAGHAAMEAYDVAWRAHRALTTERDLIGSDTMALEREREILAFQVREIDDAELTEDEDDDLRTRVVRLRHADALAADVGEALEHLGDGGSAGSLDATIAALRRAAAIDESMEGLVSDVEESATTLNELARDLARRMGDLESDPGLLDATETRLATIASLKRKYGNSVEEVLTFRKSADERRVAIDETLVSAATIEGRLVEAEAVLAAAGTRLLEHRVEAASAIVEVARRELTDLGFARPHVSILIQPSEPTATGSDRPAVMFASDEALTPGPVSSIASGGELSRLVLALTLGAGTADASVLAFDEIDTGIGGATALAMGEKLASLADHQQVICVTHLPQVAAFADVHLSVTRTGSTATIRPLDAEERVAELTRMLAGLTDSEKGRSHVEELLARVAGRSSSATD
jgi:DNA repair protein RecN (Recombination protein N)